jgi:hypothetical protein
MNVKIISLLPIILSLRITSVAAGVTTTPHIVTTPAGLKKLGLPAFSKKDQYPVIRNQLIKSGWTPYPSHDVSDCVQGDEKCTSFPEMINCQGVEEGNCSWFWNKNGKFVVIYTHDDDYFNGALPSPAPKTQN